LNKKLSDKDKKDWQHFISSEEKVQNKDLSLSSLETNKNLIKTIDLHGFSLENANRTIDEFINRCFKNNVSKITVITGKGLRSNNTNNPYVSKDLSILKNSVPEFIKSNFDLMKKIKNIKEAKIEDGGSGAFDIFLKKFKE
jgi:DNA-nicking Smr family endonuclease